ncbi:MAG: protein kinase domain-containing protein [Phycisphaerales bacterium]
MSRPRTLQPAITAFNFPPGRVLGGKYRVERKLGGGWEGEVYEVIEERTGIRRAAKAFYPQRNERDRAVRIYARKLEALRSCSMVIHYHHSETITFRKTRVTLLLSEFVEGELLSTFVRRQPGRRLPVFPALCLIHALIRGVEEIHAAKEYHGDLHAGNVLLKLHGVCFDLKVVDFYNWGRPTAAHLRDDVIDVIRLLYDAVGGKAKYASHPPAIKAICCGLRRDLIARKFPTARALREHLETFEWTD